MKIESTDRNILPQRRHIPFTDMMTDTNSSSQNVIKDLVFVGALLEPIRKIISKYDRNRLLADFLKDN